MSIYRQHLPTVLIFVVAAFLGALVFWYFVLGLGSLSGSRLHALEGAFMGAFFAFLFIRLAEALNRLYERSSANHRAAVRLQHNLNENLSLLHENTGVSRELRSFYGAGSEKAGPVRLALMRFSRLRVDRELLNDLTNVDLLNDLFGLYVQLSKLDSSLEDLNQSYDNARAALFSQTMSYASYLAFVQSTFSSLQKLEAFLGDQVSVVLRQLAGIRVLATRRSPFQRFLEAVSLRKYPRDFEVAVESELEVLHEELEDTKRRSRLRIRHVLRQVDESQTEDPH